ncbi:hypothetical protein [Streptomyces sp. NPDC002187]|uniref:hypothetical protein n=1 Tax=Streptomyces sp. NPDC002187 TaxID=3364637 RepID=UPI0036BE5A9E
MVVRQGVITHEILQAPLQGDGQLVFDPGITVALSDQHQLACLFELRRDAVSLFGMRVAEQLHDPVSHLLPGFGGQRFHDRC